jgi:hypothetical protein
MDREPVRTGAESAYQRNHAMNHAGRDALTGIALMRYARERRRGGYLTRTRFSYEVPPDDAVGFTTVISSPTIL